MKDDEKIEKYSQKNVTIVYISLCVLVSVCVCGGLYLCIIVYGHISDVWYM